MNRRVAVLLSILVVVALGVTWKRQRDAIEERQAFTRQKAYTRPPPPPRPWRWATEPEWVVHQTVRYLVSWASQSGLTDAAGTVIKVTRKSDSPDPGSFEVMVTGPANAHRFTIEPRTHVWDPSAYVGAATTLIGGPGEAGEPVAEVDDLLLSSDTMSLRKADRLLFDQMAKRPKDARLHEQASLLWMAYGMRESARGRLDPRPFLNGATAHLALARALGGERAPGPEGEIAAIAHDVLLVRQIPAMEALDRVETALPNPGRAAWARALRLRVTHDPRSLSARAPGTRLEKMEGLIALSSSRRDCAPLVAIARSWKLAPAADWARDTLRCFDDYAALIGQPLDFEIRDAAHLVDNLSESPQETLDFLKATSAADTHQPARPLSVIPLEVRADAGLIHVAAAYELMVKDMIGLGQPAEMQMFAAMTGGLLEGLPQRPALEALLKINAAGLCPQMVRWVVDRPDLLATADWFLAWRCSSESPLRMVPQDDWDEALMPGTGLYGKGAWRTGPAKGPSLDEAMLRAPWAVPLLTSGVRRNHGLEASSAVRLKAFERVLEYDVNGMVLLLRELYDNDDAAQTLAERACELDPDTCADSASYLAEVGRDDAAVVLWERGLAKARNQIGLSNAVGWYVKILLDRGEVDAALRVARRAAEVYSGAGLFTLGFAYERLGKFEEAREQYRMISERYGDRDLENRFYIRHAQRHGPEQFGRETTIAMSEVFPKGLRRKTLADFKRDPRQGFVMLESGSRLSVRLRRVGARANDFLLAIDGFVVEDERQEAAVLGFTDDPTVSLIIDRRPGGLVELKGDYRRWNFGPPGPPPSSK